MAHFNGPFTAIVPFTACPPGRARHAKRASTATCLQSLQILYHFISDDGFEANADQSRYLTDQFEI